MRYTVLVDTSAFHALENKGDVLEHEIAKFVRIAHATALSMGFPSLVTKTIPFTVVY